MRLGPSGTSWEAAAPHFAGSRNDTVPLWSVKKGPSFSVKLQSSVQLESQPLWFYLDVTLTGTQWTRSHLKTDPQSSLEPCQHIKFRSKSRESQQGFLRAPFASSVLGSSSLPASCNQDRIPTGFAPLPALLPTSRVLLVPPKAVPLHSPKGGGGRERMQRKANPSAFLVANTNTAPLRRHLEGAQFRPTIGVQEAGGELLYQVIPGACIHGCAAWHLKPPKAYQEAGRHFLEGGQLKNTKTKAPRHSCFRGFTAPQRGDPDMPRAPALHPLPVTREAAFSGATRLQKTPDRHSLRLPTCPGGNTSDS